MPKREPHRIPALGRRTGIAGVVVGSYERGDRRVTLDRADQILAEFGLELAAVPKGYDLPKLLAELDRLQAFEAHIVDTYARTQQQYPRAA